MRGFLALTGFLLLLIAAGWIALWLSLADRFENRLEAWANQRRSEGWIVAHGGIRLEGFPHVLRATVAAPEIAGAPLSDGRRRWRWQSEALIAEIDLARQDTVTLHPLGAQRAELRYAGRWLTVAGHAVDLAVQLTPDSAGGYRIDLAGRDIDLSQPALLAAIETAHVRLLLHPQQLPDQDRLLQPTFIELSGSVQGVRLAHRSQAARADFDLALMGCIGAGPLEDALAIWRDEGGTLELHQLTVQDPVIDLRLRGTLALDNAMRPLAALSGEIAGYDAIMDMLVTGGDVAGRDAVLAKLLFAAMAETNPVTGRTMINIPISIQNGIAMAGPLRLAKINPLPFQPQPADTPAKPQESPGATR